MSSVTSCHMSVFSMVVRHLTACTKAVESGTFIHKICIPYQRIQAIPQNALSVRYIFCLGSSLKNMSAAICKNWRFLRSRDLTQKMLIRLFLFNRKTLFLNICRIRQMIMIIPTRMKPMSPLFLVKLPKESRALKLSRNSSIRSVMSLRSHHLSQRTKTRRGISVCFARCERRNKIRS